MQNPKGKIFSYFSKVGVAALKLTKKLKKGDKIHIKGFTTDFTQTVDSMQTDGEDREEANSGDEIGIKVKEKVRPNDSIFLVSE